jgi:hypothetical protein
VAIIGAFATHAAMALGHRGDYCVASAKAAGPLFLDRALERHR